MIADRIARPWVKYSIMGILVVYMYGAMCLKYVAGAESFYQGIAFIVHGDATYWDDSTWAYPISIMIFGALCIAFSFGDIENSKYLQLFSAYTRIIVLGMMMFGTVYYLGADGKQAAPVWDWQNQSTSLLSEIQVKRKCASPLLLIKVKVFVSVISQFR